MNKNITGILVLCLTTFLHPAYAEDCEDNGLGGMFCINDDGTTTDSIQNEVNGQETYSSNGSVSSSSPVEDGNDQMLSGSDLGSDSDSSGTDSLLNNTMKSKPVRDSLTGRDWNSPSNLNDGSATSSMDNIR
ncbi:TPA: RND transporter [Raoultella planticola]